MQICAMADLHGTQFFTRPGDLLIIAGDISADGSVLNLKEMEAYIESLPYKKKIIIGGNHDNALANGRYRFNPEVATYLCDSGCEYMGYKIWGSPWVASFRGMNPKCKAFTLKASELKSKWKLIPSDTDILVTHNPPLGHCDSIRRDGVVTELGCPFLLRRVKRIFPAYHVFGHIHEGGASFSLEENRITKKITEFRNCSMMNPYKHSFNPPTYLSL